MPPDHAPRRFMVIVTPIQARYRSCGKKLWPYGQVYISQMKANEIHAFPCLASYVTKEKREDKKGNGARAYRSVKYALFKAGRISCQEPP